MTTPADLPGAPPEHHAMPEGEEPPPRGVKTMAMVRWVLIAALGLVAAYSVGDALHLLHPAGTTEPAAAPRYQCPMHPSVVSDRPGKCPICGMDLVPIEQHDEAKHADQNPTHESVPGLAPLMVPDERVQRIGVRTAKAESASLAGTIRTVGVVVADESRTAHVHTRFNGWVEQLMVRETGATVKRGQALAGVYSPEVLQAQQDLLVAGRAGMENLRAPMQASARSRLRLLGLDDKVIDAIQKSGKVQRTVTLTAPMDGVITQKAAIEGVYVTPETHLFEIADLSVVWLLVDVREDQLARVKVGQKVSVQFAALPDTQVSGTLTYLYPGVDAQSRTLKARVELGNPRRVFHPGMYGTAEIALAPAQGVVVPSEAVVQTGTQTYVFVAKGGGTYEPRKVKIGAQTPERMELTAGVDPGEEVVTSALFLLDSESRLRATLNSGNAAPAPAAGHAGHKP